MKQIFGSILAVAAMAGSASAVTITQWDLAGDPGNQITEPASSSAANVSGSAITRGAGLTASAGGSSFSATSWENAAQGAASTEYFSFGFTVAGGFQVNLDSLYIGTRSSSSGPGSMGLYYSGDGFATNLITFNQAPGVVFVNSVVDLSALPDLSGVVEFRLIEVGNTQAGTAAATAATGAFRVTAYFVAGVFDRNLQFTGEVVPTPGALALVGVAGLVGIRRRRA